MRASGAVIKVSGTHDGEPRQPEIPHRLWGRTMPGCLQNRLDDSPLLSGLIEILFQSPTWCFATAAGELPSTFTFLPWVSCAVAQCLLQPRIQPEAYSSLSSSRGMLLFCFSSTFHGFWARISHSFPGPLRCDCVGAFFQIFFPFNQ